MAISICDLSNPILSRFAIASARWAPIVIDEGSVNDLVVVGVSAVVAAAPAGEGVAGAAAVVEVLAGAGAAGVATEAGAGVDGAFEDVAAAAGAALGCYDVSLDLASSGSQITFCTMHTMNPFSSILYNSTVLASCKIFPRRDVS